MPQRQSPAVVRVPDDEFDNNIAGGGRRRHKIPVLIVNIADVDVGATTAPALQRDLTRIVGWGWPHHLDRDSA